MEMTPARSTYYMELVTMQNHFNNMQELDGIEITFGHKHHSGQLRGSVAVVMTPTQATNFILYLQSMLKGYWK